MSTRKPTRMGRHLLISLFCMALAGTTHAADHREAPSIQGDPEADIADLYAFLDLSDPDDLVLIMTVNPFSVPAEATTYSFDTEILYRFNVDNSGDAVADAVIDVTFRAGPGGGQIMRAVFPGGVVVEGPVTQPTLEVAANPPIVTESSGMRIFAGPRDDPFYFEAVGFARVLAGTGGFVPGRDAFAGFNVSAIAVAVPLASVANEATQLQIWAETYRARATLRQYDGFRVERHGGGFQRVDRMGNPAVSTVLIPKALRDFYNLSEPKDDAANFTGPITDTLTALNTNSENIEILAGVAIPDTLKLDLTSAVLYPNGRSPEDDVIDTLLFFIFNGVSTPDMVPFNDGAPLGTFPFLADPHQP